MDYFNNINLFNNRIFQSKFITFILIMFLVLTYGLIDVNAKEINPNGYYGATMCTEVVTGAGQSNYVDCSYQNSQIVQGESTTYTMLPKAVESFDGSTQNYYVVNRLWFFAYYEFKKGNYYTLNFSFDNGSYMLNNLTNYSNFSDLTYGYFHNNDYIQDDGLTLTGYSINYNSSEYKGTISITFKATEDTSSYRFWIDGLPLLRNRSFDYSQGYRVYLLSAFEEENNDSALLQQITNQNNTIINQNQQQINQQQQTNDKLDKFFDDEPLSDEVIDEFFDGIGANFTTDTPISDLLLMPLTILEAYSNGISSSCSSFNLGSLFGTELIMPCIDLKSILGSSLWSLIDTIISLFMFYNIAMLVVSIFDSVTSLEDSFQLLYSPRHTNLTRVSRGENGGLY